MMKKRALFLGFLFVTLLVLLPNCGGDAGGNMDDGSLLLTVVPSYSNLPFSQVKYLEVELQGDVQINVNFEEEGQTKELTVFAAQKGFYSEVYHCLPGDVITVSLSPIKESHKQTGVLFATDPHDGNIKNISSIASDMSTPKFNDTELEIIPRADDSGHYFLDDYLFDTDKVPQFSAGSHPEVEGGWTCAFECGDTINRREHYQDWIYWADACGDTGKPNIYLYPEATIDLSVSISFPQGGHLTKSDPEYGNGWDVTVEPDGTIDNYHTFLFYEALVPAKYQEERGFVVKKEHLEEFFTENLTKSGFEGQEIEDFLEWWMIRLLDSPYYVIYPQYENDIAKLIQIEFSQKPDNFRRLYYLVQRTENPEDFAELEPPTIPPFERKGFFAVDWGLVQYRTKNSVR